MEGRRISHFVLEQKLGEGTYGEVYRARHAHLPDMCVAIKILHKNLANDAHFVAGLKAECLRLAALSHRNIVSFRDLVLGEDHPPAMVLELLDGADLHAAVQRGPMPVVEVVRVVDAMLSGLSWAHKKGVVHRDVKPSNVMLCQDGEVKLLDFGIARAADGSNATKTGVIQGTFDYLPPEAFRGEIATGATDVYATGLVAWELLTGETACATGPLHAKMGWHMGVGVTDVRLVRPDCPDWLAEVVNTLSAKEVAVRPVDGAAALAMLRAAVPAGGVVEPKRVVTEVPRGPGTVELHVDDLAVSAAASRVASATVEAPIAPATVEAPIAVMAPPAPAPAPVPAPAPAPTLSHSRATPQSQTNSIGMRFVSISAGSFMMGATREQGSDSINWEKPAHKVTLTRPFLLGAVPVTQGQWRAVMGDNPSFFGKHYKNAAVGWWRQLTALLGVRDPKWDEHPVETVSWYDAVEFANKLSANEGLQPAYSGSGDTIRCDKSANGYRLPTEAEWEYAARAGQGTKYAGSDDADAVAWHLGNSGLKTHRVGQQSPNRWGLYDMSGNVWEWTADWYGGYSSGELTDPEGASSGSYRVFRGGSWNGPASGARVANRGSSRPVYRYYNLGFRLARTSP